MPRRIRCWTVPLPILLLLMVSPLVAQTLPAGPQVLSFFSDVDDTEQPYAIYIPPGYNPSRAYPLVISLHGAGSNHRLNLQRVFGRSNAPGETDVEASRAFAEWEDRDVIVASPYARGTMGYQGVAEKDVLDVLADVKRRFRIDEDRVYLTGLSMGGGGTLWLGLTRPDLWAAIAAVCPAPPKGTERFAVNAGNLPAHFFHGTADQSVPVDVSRRWVELLQDVGTYVDYEEYEGVGHDSWTPAYAGGRVFDWFAQFKRNPHPERVRFATDRYENDGAYWVRFDRFTPGTIAHIDARMPAPNAVDVTTSDLQAFTLTFSGHPLITGQAPVRVTIDGAAFEASGPSASFHRVDGTWREGLAARADAPIKRKGAEGPMNRIVAARHVVVYGTRGTDDREDVQARQAEAVEAGTWSDYRGLFLGRVMVFPRIISDREVRPSDLERGNLILLGTAETNQVIAELADRLPMHLTGDPARYGLVYIYPAGDHTVLVSSGVPWWQAPTVAGATRFAGGAPPFLLSDTNDFMLFDLAEGVVLAAGRFDGQWQLPPDALEAIRASDAVAVRPASSTD